MTSTNVFEAQSRNTTGTGNARAVRREKRVPGVIYGIKKDPESVSLDEKILTKEIMTPGFFSRLYAVSINGKEQPVLIKDVQLHPVTDRVMHIDFQRVDKTSKIHVSIPIIFINEDKSPGVKRGGMVNVVHHTLEVVCLATAIPESLTVDLTGTESNQAIHLGDLKLPKGVEAAHPERDHTIATIVPPAGAAAATEEA